MIATSTSDVMILSILKRIIRIINTYEHTDDKYMYDLYCKSRNISIRQFQNESVKLCNDYKSIEVALIRFIGIELSPNGDTSVNYDEFLENLVTIYTTYNYEDETLIDEFIKVLWKYRKMDKDAFCNGLVKSMVDLVNVIYLDHSTS